MPHKSVTWEDEHCKTQCNLLLCMSMITSADKPTGAGASSLWKTGAVALALLISVALLFQHPGKSQSQNESGISLEIRCTNSVLKVGDEIPIEFIIRNHGKEDHEYDSDVDRSFRIDEYELVAKSRFGARVPDPFSHTSNRFSEGSGRAGVLHPGKAFSKIIPLNRWALIKEPGRYEVVGIDHVIAYPNKPVTPVRSAPISITVLPRTKAEMEAYINGLTNQVEERLSNRAVTNRMPLVFAVEDSLVKMMYTCSPEIIPTLLHAMSAHEPGVASDAGGYWAPAALMYYMPRTEATWKTIFEAAAKNNVMNELLLDYEFSDKEIKPRIERALAANQLLEWRAGAGLAAKYYDDAFTTRLIAIASDTNAEVSGRGEAIKALAWNRTDAGARTLKTLLNDPDPKIWSPLASAIVNGCNSQFKTPTGRHLLPEDFDAKDVRPLIERLLGSTNERDTFYGVCLAGTFPDDGLSPQLVTLARTPGDSPERAGAIRALALNRTEEGVKALKTLLNDPNPKTSKMAADAIHNAYATRLNAQGRPLQGRPLRVDDFDANLRQP